MSLQADELVSHIDEEISRLARSDDVLASARASALGRLREALERAGYVTDSARRRELSLLPFLFQEANHDGVDWTDRAAPLGRLSALFEIDVAAQSCGRERHDLTDREFDAYVEASLAAIAQR